MSALKAASFALRPMYSWLRFGRASVEGKVNVSSPLRATMLFQPPGTMTVFSWLWRPWFGRASKIPVTVSRYTA